MFISLKRVQILMCHLKGRYMKKGLLNRKGAVLLR